MKLRLLPKEFWTKAYWTPGRAGRYALGFFALLLALAGGALAFVMSEAGRDALAPRLVAALAPEGGAIRYERLSGDWPHEIIVENLHVSDAQGEWLTVKRLALEWTPWQILRRNVDVALLRIETPVIARLPHSASSQSEGAFSLDLPVDLHLGALELTQGELRAPLSARFEAQGRLALEKGRAVAQIEARRLGGPQEFLKLDGAFDARNRVLKLNADLKGAQGGLLATLAGLPDLPAIALKVKGEGPAQDWKLALRGEAEGLGDLALAGALNWADEIALDLTGKAHAGRNLPVALRALAGKETLLDAHWSRKGGADELKTAFGSDAADLNVNIALGAETLLKARVLTGSISAQTKAPVALDGGVKLDGLTAAATLSGTVRAPDLAVTLDARGLDSGAARIGNFKGLVNLESRQGAADTRYRVTGSGDMQDIVQKGTTFVDAATWALAATHEGPYTELSEAKLTAQGLAVTASGSLDVKTGAGKGKAHLQADELAALAPLLGAQISGAGQLDVTAAREALATPWRIAGEGNTRDLVISDISFAPIAGPDLALAARLTLAATGAMELDEATIKGETLALAAQGALSPRLDARASLNGTLAILEPLAGLGAQGPLDVALKATGTLDAPLLDATAQSARAIVEGRDLGAVKASLAPLGQGGFASQLAQFEAKGPLGDASLRAPLHRQDGALAIGPIEGNVYGAVLSGDLTSGPKGLNGALKAVIANLATLAPIALGPDAKADGNALADLQFQGEDGLSAKVSARGVALSAPAISASQLNANARIGKDIAIDLALQGGELPGVSAPIFYDTLALKAAGPRKAIKVEFKSAGLTGAGGSLSLNGTLDTESATRSFDIVALSGQLWGTPVRLAKPARVTFGTAGTALSKTVLRVETSGVVTASFAQKPQGQTLDLALDAFPVSFLGHVANVDWPQGTLAGKIALDTARGRGDLDMTLKDGQFARATMTRMTPVSGTARGSWNGKIVSIKSDFRRETGAPILIEGQLPLEKGSGGALRLNPGGKVAGHILWEGRVGTLWTFLPLDLYRVDGDGRLAVTAAGTWGRPRIEGRFDLARGTFEGLSTGTRLSDLAVALDASADAAHFTLSGTDGGSGRLKGEGRMSFDTARDFPLEGSLDLAGLRIVGLDEVTAVASGHTALTGSLGAMALKGDLTFDRVDALIPDKLPPSVPQLPVTYANATPEQDAAAGGEAEASGIALDIKVKVPARASLNGRGLISEWKGDLAVSGASSAPVIVGEAKLARGTLAFAGRSFPLTKGTVSFDGGPEIDPRLDIAAVRSVNGIEITLAVTGRASAPIIAISAQPPVPQDEAMALLLLGKPAGALTPLELLDVARAMATLSGTSIGAGGIDVVDRARRTLGLDVLTLDTSTGAGGEAKGLASSASISAGRYVSEKVYLGVKQGVAAGSSAVEMEIELTPNISATTQVGQQTGGSAGINWKWDY